LYVKARFDPLLAPLYLRCPTPSGVLSASHPLFFMETPNKVGEDKKGGLTLGPSMKRGLDPQPLVSQKTKVPPYPKGLSLSFAAIINNPLYNL